VVARQRAARLDVISDGEQAKTGFFAYIGERLGGFEPRPGRDPLAGFRAEIDSFPEYYAQYLKGAMIGGMAAPAVPLGCTGPVSYTGHRRLEQDLDTLRAAVGEAGPDEVFVCAVAPSGVGGNEYFPDRGGPPGRGGRRAARGVRGHCRGGLHPADRRPVPHRRVQLPPRDRGGEAGAGAVVRERDQPQPAGHPAGAGAAAHLLRHQRGSPGARRAAGRPRRRLVHDPGRAFSFEAANPRHEHVYHVFESVKPPPDAALLPRVISHATSIVEHPDAIADRIVRFAELVGRENVVASADCGFSSQATYSPEIHPAIVWAKFESLTEGARRATDRLWP
jgi:5-methyltetrahydropteroyltriglutamate--homocysteine methyltransferase